MNPLYSILHLGEEFNIHPYAHLWDYSIFETLRDISRKIRSTKDLM